MEAIRHLSSTTMISVCLLLVACGSQRDFAGSNPEAMPQVIASMGVAQACTADLVVQIKRPDADSLTFTVNLWVDSHNRFRLHLTKLGKAFLSGRIDPDGSLKAMLVLDRVAVTTDLDQLAVSAKELDAERGGGSLAEQQLNLLTDLRLLIDEIKSGPVPQAVSYSLSPVHNGAIVCTMAGDLQAHFTIDDGRNPEVDHKWLYREDGSLLADIEYDNYKHLGTARRPTRIQIDLPRDDNTYRVRVRRFDAVPGIGSDRMQVAIPDDYQELEPKAFLDAMIGESSE